MGGRLDGWMGGRVDVGMELDWVEWIGGWMSG